MCEPEAPMDSRGASHHEKGDSGCGFCISEYRITEAFVKEIQKNYWFSALFRCRTPRGVRGLKSPRWITQACAAQVAPREGCVD